MRSTRSRGVVGTCLGALVVWMGWSAPARAQPPGVPAASATEKQLYDDGFDAAKRGQWEQAYPHLADAWELERRWQVAKVLGQTEVELGKYRDAAEHLTFFLRETRDVAEVGAGERATMERLLVRARAHVGALTVVVEPPGAEVVVDGVRVGKAPLADPVYLPPGWRRVEARLPGYRPAGDAYQVDAGRTARVELRMARMPIPAPQPQPRGWRGVDTGVVIGGVLVTAAAGVGAGFAVWSNRSARDSRTYQACQAPCTKAEYTSSAARFDELQSRRTLQAYVSIWSFVGAGALAVGTVTYAIAAPRVKRPIKVTGLVAPGGATAALSVGW